MGKTRPQREMGYRFGTAGLVEADQVKSKVLDPVERPRADRPVLDALGPWLEPRHQPVGVYLALVDDRYPSTDDHQSSILTTSIPMPNVISTGGCRW